MREFTFSTQAAPGFRSGQYALFYLPGLDAPRTYSMSNADNGSGAWEFIVRRVPGGVGTVTLFDRVKPGMELRLDGPYGMAFLREDSPRDIVCIAGDRPVTDPFDVSGAAQLPHREGRRIHVSTARTHATSAGVTSFRRCRTEDALRRSGVSESDARGRFSTGS